MANRNRIGRPLLALCISIIVVAADIMLFIIWIERLPPRTWICIYISNYHFIYRRIPFISVKF